MPNACSTTSHRASTGSSTGRSSRHQTDSPLRRQIIDAHDSTTRASYTHHSPSRAARYASSASAATCPQSKRYVRATGSVGSRSPASASPSTSATPSTVGQPLLEHHLGMRCTVCASSRGVACVDAVQFPALCRGTVGRVAYRHHTSLRLADRYPLYFSWGRHP